MEVLLIVRKTHSNQSDSCQSVYLSFPSPAMKMCLPLGTFSYLILVQHSSCTRESTLHYFAFNSWKNLNWLVHFWSTFTSSSYRSPGFAMMNFANLGAITTELHQEADKQTHILITSTQPHRETVLWSYARTPCTTVCSLRYPSSASQRSQEQLFQNNPLSSSNTKTIFNLLYKFYLAVKD